MPYNSHVKSTVLKRIIQKDAPCNDKLQELSNLLGLPAPTPSVEDAVVRPDADVVRDDADAVSGESSGDNVPAVEISERQKSYDRILSDLNGQEKKNAKNILLRIESAPNISWDYKTDVISINSEPQLHSNVKDLVTKSVVASSRLLPISFIRYVSSLIDLSLPVQYLTNLDTLHVRKELLAIRKAQLKASEASASEGDVGESLEPSENSGVTEEESENVTTPKSEEIDGSNGAEAVTSRKRSREEALESGDDDQETDERPVKLPKVIRKRKDKVPTEGTRRSSRLQLKPEIQRDWSSL